MIAKLSTLLCATLAMATLEVRTGLLDRLVQHYKKDFFQDLLDVAPIQVNVSIQRRPPGYVESSAWDYDSVVRLVGLIRGSEATLPRAVRTALREFLKPLPVPSRRYGGMGLLHKARERALKMKKCLGDPTKPGYPKYCPKNGLRRSRLDGAPGLNGTGKPNNKSRINMKLVNSINRIYVPSLKYVGDLYYDEMISVEVPMLPKSPKFAKKYNMTKEDEKIVVISNPVEARLPSGYISIGTLRRILEERADAARVMPTIPTTTMDMPSKTTIDGDSTSGENTKDAGATGAATGAANGAATGDTVDGAATDGARDTTADAGGDVAAADDAAPADAPANDAAGER